MYALMNDNPERMGGERESEKPIAEKERRKKPSHHEASKTKKESRERTKTTKRDSKDKAAASKPKRDKERKHKTEHRKDDREHHKDDDRARREKQRKHKSKSRQAGRERANHEQEQQQETTCFCQKSLRALKPQDVNLFLPRYVVCTCGRQQEEDDENIAIGPSDQQYPLDDILRPWQAEFLENEFMVATIPELLASCERIGPVMAREMKRWCKHSLMAPMVRDVQSCTLALFIWAKSCKMILAASKRASGAVLYKVKVREPLTGNHSSRFLNKDTRGDAVPKVVVIPPSCRDDEVSACSSQGASTVLEDFLENIFHWELPNQEKEKPARKKKEHAEEEPHDKPKTVEVRKRSKASSYSEHVDYHDDGWDLLTPRHDEYAPVIEISNMDEVMVSLEMYECMDKTMSRAALEQKLAKMSSVLNRVNINLITTDSPPIPEDNKSMESVGGSVHKERRHRHERRRHKEVKYKDFDDDDESENDDTTVTEPTTKSATVPPKGGAAQKKKGDDQEHLTTRARRPRLRRDQWHSSIAYLAAFDGVEDTKQKQK